MKYKDFVTTLSKIALLQRCYPPTDNRSAIELVKELRNSINSTLTHQSYTYLEGYALIFNDVDFVYHPSFSQIKE